MDFDFNEYISTDEYKEITGLSDSGFTRRKDSINNPIIFTEFDLEIIKKLDTDRYNKDIARAIMANEKVKLISKKLNTVSSRSLRGRPAKNN